MNNEKQDKKGQLKTQQEAGEEVKYIENEIEEAKMHCAKEEIF
jgi:hypothetical protein